MAPPLVRRPPQPWLPLVSVVLLLAGCSPWWQRQPASQDSRLQQQCQALEAQRLGLEQQRQADAQGLAAVTAEAYQPSPAPQAPDPELASRYSQLDREIDEERYANALETWRQREQQRRQRWIDNRHDRRQRLQQRLNNHSKLLSAVEPRLKLCRSQR
jgi:DNA-binding transcriptional regulator YbjK